LPEISTNGTFVNSQRVDEEVLKVRDELLIGTTILVFEDKEAEASLREASDLFTDGEEDGADIESRTLELDLGVSGGEVKEGVLQRSKYLQFSGDLSRILQGEEGLDKLLDQAVEEDYSGLVRGMLMHMPEDKIFRTTDKGALFDGDIWRVLQSTAEGKKLDRLFTFPERLLSEAAKKPQKVEWLASKEKPSEEVREGATGKTAVAGREESRLYHRLSVTLPEKTALKYFIEVQNSGCLSGG
jgi:pSer/pThr/pTyr-binding forkhead associated (FHA) protein